MDNTTAHGMRLHIGLFGRTNVGKSTFLNAIAGQDVSITSPVPGTTTDVVVKSMELLPVGPVLFLDTGGLDDGSLLGKARATQTARAMDRTDVAVLVCEGDRFETVEESVLKEARRRALPVLAVVNKVDRRKPSRTWLEEMAAHVDGLFCCSAADPAQWESIRNRLKEMVCSVSERAVSRSAPLVGDLLPPGGLAVLVVPIDMEAPKGRLILPQVQTIRDALDHDAAAVVVKESEYPRLLSRLKRAPDLVVCDSQVVGHMVANTPPPIPCTTFSILFARLKGDLRILARGAAAIDDLVDGDRILIAESCSHHPLEDDIGRVKIPRWLRRYTGVDLEFEVTAGRDFPTELADYALIVQCGGCMNNRAEMLGRLRRAAHQCVPITNYGVCISKTQGVLQRVLSPFAAAIGGLFHPTATIEGGNRCTQ